MLFFFFKFKEKKTIQASKPTLEHERKKKRWKALHCFASPFSRITDKNKKKVEYTEKKLEKATKNSYMRMHINTASIHTAMLSFLRSFLSLEANQKKKNYKLEEHTLSPDSYVQRGKEKRSIKKKKVGATSGHLHRFVYRLAEKSI